MNGCFLQGPRGSDGVGFFLTVCLISPTKGAGLEGANLDVYGFALLCRCGFPVGRKDKLCPE